MSKEIPQTIQLDNQQISIPEIHCRFKQEHPAGFRLKYQQVRWSRFQPQNTSQYEWQSPRVLSLDANNLEHCYLTFLDTIRFIETQNQSDSPIKFNHQETTLLLFMAETHDWGEGVTKKGDVNYEAKTRQDEIEELNVLGTVITDILGCGSETKELTHQVKFYLDSDNVDFKLSQAFNAIEHIGYFQTAMRAWQKIPEYSTKNPVLAKNLSLLANNVLINDIDLLIKYAQIYPRVKIVLQNQKHWVDQAFAMKKSVMDHYDKAEKIPEYKEKFAKAKSSWNRWAKQNL